MATISKKFYRAILLVFVLVMALGIVATPAFAANDREYYKVYVNGVETSAQAYIMADSFYMLGDEFKRIIPEANNVGIGTNTQVLISYYAEKCNYDFSYDYGAKAVYLVKIVAPTPTPVPTPTPQPTEPPIVDFKVFKGFVKVQTRLTVENNVIRFVSYNDAVAMFGNTWRVNGLALNDWANTYGFSVYQSGMKLYILERGISPFEVYIKGTLVEFEDVQAQEMDKRVFVPVVEACKVLGLNTYWDEQNKAIYVYDRNCTVCFWVGNEYYKSGSNTYRMDIKPVMINDTVLIPMEYVVWSFGYKVTRNDRNAIHILSVDQ